MTSNFLQLFISILVASATLLPIAFAFHQNYLLNKYFDMRLAAYATLSPYLVFGLISIGIDISLSCILSIVLVTIISWIVEQIQKNSVKENSKKHDILNDKFILSLGIYFLTLGLVVIFYGTNLKSFTFERTLYYFSESVFISNIEIATIIFSILITTACIFFLKLTTSGKQLRAVANNENLAKTVGINTNQIKLVANTLFGGLAGISGIMLALNTSLSPDIGLTLIIKSLLVSLISSEIIITQLLVAVTAVHTFEVLAISLLGGIWKETILLTVLLLVVLIKSKKEIWTTY